jgi:uncharacterized membrane protein YgdD (TMEM256/DUF423 family)
MWPATGTRDLLLRRSFHVLRSTAVFLVRAGLLVAWLPLDVSGFRSVLAREWHAARLSMRTVGTTLFAGELYECALTGAYRSPSPSRQRSLPG